jgi:hypothetical protein
MGLGRFSRWLALAVLVSPVALLTSEASAELPDASVQIVKRAAEGPRGTIMARVRLRCAPGFEFADLVLDFSQGDVTTPSTSATPPPGFECDGRGHRQNVTSLEAFEAGAATMTARLSVTDVETGDPGRQAVDTERIWVRAAAAVRLRKVARLHSDGSVTVVVRTRCDRPWVEPSLVVSLTQYRPDGTGIGATGVAPQDALTCDNRWHRLKLRADPAEGAFRRGAVEAQAFLDILTPVDFDPVTQAQHLRTLRVV